VLAKKQLKKSTKRLTRNTKIELLKFLLRFVLLSLPIAWIVDLNFYSLQKIISIIVHYLFIFAGMNNVLFDTLSTNLVISPAMYFLDSGLIIAIDAACTGIRSFYLLFALLFSFRWEWKKQLKYLLLGGIILFLVNIFRILIVTLLVVNFQLPELFDNILWTGSLNLTVLLIIIYYLKH